MKTCYSTIEPLESRIAPAAVVVTYTDVDGELVKIRDSSGHLTSTDLTFVGGGASGQLAELNLTSSAFAGASITFTVVHKPGDNGVANVGFIDAGTNSLGAVTIKGDLGRIDAGAGVGTAIGSLSVDSLGRLGTATQQGLASPSLESAISGALGSLTVSNDVAGALILVSNGGIGPVTIGGSLIGGTGSSSGLIHSSNAIGAISIGGSLRGGSISGTTASLDSSGLIISEDGTISSVNIGGSIISGTDTSTGGSLTNNASIRAGAGIGSLTVAGSLIGNPDGGTGDAASPVVITAEAAIGRITVGGRVEDAVILTGYDTGLNAVNGSAQIGAVKVAGDWIASDLVAGASNSDTPAGAPFANFGNTDDASIAGVVISKIASITIDGQVFGTLASVSATDNYGFVAQGIGPVRIGGYAFPIAAGNNPQPVGETGDVDIHIIT